MESGLSKIKTWLSYHWSHSAEELIYAFQFYQAKFKDKGTEIAEDQFSQMAKQMEKFRENLEDFAAKHKEDIRKDANFRVQFQEMCASIGVDPLASSKGFWAEMLGVGDFYYELGVQIVEVCLATSHRNGDTQKTAASIKKTKRGEMQKDRFQEINTVQMVVGSDPQKNIKIYGLVGVEELRERLVRSRGKKSQDISIDDLLRAIKKLKVLGNGFTVIPLGGTYLIQSVPGELSMDHTTLLTQAQEAGFVTKSQLLSKLKWEEERANRALDYMVKEGLAWVDRQAKQETEYWFPSFFPDTSLQSPT